MPHGPILFHSIISLKTSFILIMVAVLSLNCMGLLKCQNFQGFFVKQCNVKYNIMK